MARVTYTIKTPREERKENKAELRKRFDALDFALEDPNTIENDAEVEERLLTISIFIHNNNIDRETYNEVKREYRAIDYSYDDANALLTGDVLGNNA